MYYLAAFFITLGIVLFLVGIPSCDVAHTEVHAIKAALYLILSFLNVFIGLVLIKLQGISQALSEILAALRPTEEKEPPPSG